MKPAIMPASFLPNPAMETYKCKTQTEREIHETPLSNCDSDQTWYFFHYMISAIFHGSITLLPP